MALAAGETDFAEDFFFVAGTALEACLPEDLALPAGLAVLRTDDFPVFDEAADLAETLVVVDFFVAARVVLRAVVGMMRRRLWIGKRTGRGGGNIF